MLLSTKSKGDKSNAPYSGFPNYLQTISNLHISIHHSQIHYSDAATGRAGWTLAHQEFGSSVNPTTTRGQIMSTTLLLAHLALKTQRHLCKVYPTRYQYPLTNYLGQKGVNHIRTIPIANSTVTWLPSGYFLKKQIRGCSQSSFWIFLTTYPPPLIFSTLLKLTKSTFLDYLAPSSGKPQWYMRVRKVNFKVFKKLLFNVFSTLIGSF